MKQFEIISILKTRLWDYEGFDAGLLIGSFARGDAKLKSDIDISIKYNNKFD